MNPIQSVLSDCGAGHVLGIPAYCTANRRVLAAILRDAAKHNRLTLIEATANQVNQFGGYTGMRPKEFVKFVEHIADEVKFPIERLVLGGDHLGPLAFSREPEVTAMQKAEELVYDYAAAGFAKLHLDTSMRLADDPEGPLDQKVVARRGARLCKAAEKGYQAFVKAYGTNAVHPVYVIGSEVPIPGGTTDGQQSIHITSPEDCLSTILAYQEAFAAEGLEEAWKYVIAIVAQIGVEFGDNAVSCYNSKNTERLTAVLKEYPQIVFEGHSTDYQPQACLNAMVKDGIAILKVGPALTFALREGLFALSSIEAEMISVESRANVPAELERAMLEHPENWQRHYHGSEDERRLARQYSLSDRARYYLGETEVESAIERLIKNLSDVNIPIGLMHQYFPEEAIRCIAGEITCTPSDLLESTVMRVVNTYITACASQNT